MKPYWCRGCERLTMRLKSRCLMQIKPNRWNGHCIQCCCLNSRRQKECDDPTGLGWQRGPPPVVKE